MKLKNAAIVYMKEKSKEHDLTLKKVKKTLKKHKINFKAVERSRINTNLMKNKDLIIVVGGDGTFLKAAHSIKNELVLGVNSDIRRKEGFYMQADRFDFDIKFEKVLRGNFNIRKYNRLEAHIDGKKLPDLALNEFYIGHKNAYDLSRYFLIVGNKRVYHKSSGLLVGTGSGSHGWLAHAGGRKMKPTSKKMQFVAREFYTGNLFKKEMPKGVVGQNKDVIVESASDSNIVVADSLRKEYPLKKGHKVKIKQSKQPLRTVFFH